MFYSMKIQLPHADLSSPVERLSFFSIILVSVLVLSTPSVEMGNTLPESFKIYRLYGYAILAVIQLVLIFIRPNKHSLAIYITPIILLMLWCCISLTWSEHIDLTAKRTVLLCLVYLSVFGSVCDLGYRRSLETLQFLLAATLIINLAAVIVNPEVGTQLRSGSDDLWRGLMADKNIAGMLSAVTLVVFGFGKGRIPLPLRYGIMAAALLFLVQSWSRTAIIALVASVAVGISLTLMRLTVRNAMAKHRKSITYVASTIAGFLVVAVLVLTIERDFLVSLTDNASSVSLRNTIWRPLIQYYLDHPILGSGYGAYWDASVRPENVEAYATQRWLIRVDQGHNGYLDLLVQTGLPGLILALLATIWWPLRRLASLTQRHPERSSVIFSMITLVLVQNFAESSLFADDSLGNFFLLFALAQTRRFEIGEAKFGKNLIKKRTFSYPEMDHTPADYVVKPTE